jgi:hypothetical protein
MDTAYFQVEVFSICLFSPKTDGEHKQIKNTRPPSKMATVSRHSFNIGRYGENVLKRFTLKPVSQFKANVA